jgi:hypothetical protein
MRSGTWATKRVLADPKPAMLGEIASDELGVRGAIVERSVRAWPCPSRGSRSSSTDRMSLRSISIWENVGVPRVMTM